MPLPILPILMAIPPIASIIHDLFGERPADNTHTDNTQKVRELLELTEVHLREVQERWVTAERKLAVAEDRLAEAQKKRGWWPWSKQR